MEAELGNSPNGASAAAATATGIQRPFAVHPSALSSNRDFDFLVGHWTVRNRKLRTRLKGDSSWDEFDAIVDCKTSLLGLANEDLFQSETSGLPFQGMSLRLFDPQTRLWSINWADSIRGRFDPPVIGSFDGPLGRFYAEDEWEGASIIVCFEWDKSNPITPVWRQAFSADKGQSWEWNWLMRFAKRGS